MVKIKNIIKNFSSLIFAQFFYKLCSFAVYIIIAKTLGVAEFGKLSLAISFVALFGFVLDMGLSELFVRDIAGSNIENAKRYLKNIISLKLFLSIIVFILVFIICLISQRLRALMPVILVITGAYILELYTFLFRSVFRTYERMEIEAFTFVVDGILRLSLFLILLTIYRFNILLVAEILLFINLIILLLNIYILQKKFLIPRLAFDFYFYKDLIKKTIPFVLIFCFGVISFKIDIIMVSSILGDKPTGWFSAAVRLVEPILIIPTSIAVAFFPVVSRSKKQTPQNLLPLFKNAIFILLLLGLPLVILLNLAAKFVIGITFGKNFLESVYILRILSWVLLPFFLKFFLERFILSLGVSKILFLSYFIGTLLNIILNLAFIKPFGLIGVSVATLISETTIIGLNLLYLRRRTLLIA